MSEEKAIQKDAVFDASIEFIKTLTGMEPPPIEIAPPEVLKPFREFTEKVCSIFHNSPPQRTWVGLTDHEIEMIYAVTIKIRKKDIMPGEQQMFAKTIQHFLKERNT